jgi:hypothetical protein
MLSNKIKLISGVMASVVTVTSTLVGVLADWGDAKNIILGEDEKKDSVVVEKVIKDSVKEKLSTLPTMSSPTIINTEKKKPSKVELYLNNPSANKSDVKDIGIAIILEENFDNEIGNEVVNLLRQKGYANANNYFFKQKGLKDGYLGQLYNASELPMKETELANFVDYVFIGYLKIDHSQTEIVERQIHKCMVKFQGNLINVKEGSIEKNISFNLPPETDFNQTNALVKAKKSLIKELEKLL